MKITHVSAEEITDSRFKPTLRVRVMAEGGEAHACEVPSGASTGAHEAHELRDSDGLHVQDAIRHIEGEIRARLVGMDVREQAALDEALIALDGTPDRSRLGGNSLIGVSIAAAKAGAAAKGVELYEHLRSMAQIEASREVPLLFINLFNGGKHAAAGTPIQEHQIIPHTDDLNRALEMATRVQFALNDHLAALGSTSEGDEGGVVAMVSSVEEPFAYLHEALEATGLSGAVMVGADIAASSITRAGENYVLFGEQKSAAQMGELYRDLKQKYNLTHIEDPFGENDFAEFAQLAASDPSFTVIGDDLTTTNASRIAQAAGSKSISAVIIKPNQVGTVTETIAAMQAARKAGIHCIASHRSGETMDDFVADFAFAFGCYGMKAGAPHRPERRVKYDRLIKLTYA